MSNKSRILIALIIMVFLTTYPVAYRMSIEEVEIIIKDKQSITTGSGDRLENKFLIFTKGEVFENSDSFLYFKFNSSDYQNDLEVGKTYKTKVVGWRVPFFSMYRNIVEYEIGN